MKALIIALVICGSAVADQTSDALDMLNRQSERYGSGLDTRPLLDLSESIQRQNAPRPKRNQRCVARPRPNPWTGNIDVVIDCEG
jgi:hypothetical protein